MVKYLEVGNDYSFKRNDIVFTAKVIMDLDFDNDYLVEITGGKYSVIGAYNIGDKIHISLDMVNSYFEVTELEEIIPETMDENEMSSPIEMTVDLYHVYVNMAIDTKDTEWLKELGQWAKTKGVRL